ncbi:MAG: cobyrinate a,c-diamide synthase [Hyphomicrobiales bacterium]|nr:cobyrinate a,c-diamide synthase [Hyphomicrobiales bacterium]MCP5001199.1 cobyrinate a,c-diamide synthase [Hyphomicrobiales bacterium]
MSGLLIASPMSGSGKTTFTLGLLRALKLRGIDVAPGKAGPDYIDPAFHAAASSMACLNYDPWGMRCELLLANAGLAGGGGRLLVVEAMMGLFDAAADGTGAAADIAELLKLPVVFVVNCAKISHSVAALVRGFGQFDPNVMIAGVILNNVGSDRHEAMLRDALDAIGMDVLGSIRRDDELIVPERHLGLIQATEHDNLEAFISRAAELVEAGCDVERIVDASRLLGQPDTVSNIERLPPPGQRIAIARDPAFSFCYEHMLLGWRRRGAQISFFSPLADEGPAKDCDAVYLPGGYPELNGDALANAAEFRSSMKTAADRNARIYGECGGYMVLGDAVIDKDCKSHAMLGLLPHTTSFATRKLHLGYRRVRARKPFHWGMPLTAHEFHYASIVEEGKAERLFDVEDAVGRDLGPAGLQRGSVAGSFIHVIDLADGA